MKKIQTEGLPILSWCEHIDENALEQAHNLARHPSLVFHVALMPDCHSGYGMPIGGVVASPHDVIPFAVGVDIGCGMCAVRTSYMASDLKEKKIKRIMGFIREDVPVGFNHRGEPVPWDGWEEAPEYGVVQKEVKSGRHQLGTLGSGNHFIEIQEGDDGHVWLMLHSGSRNFGYKIANYYAEVAKSLCDKYHVKLPDKDLAFLPFGDDAGRRYVECMQFALRFAQANRDVMMELVKEAAFRVLKCEFDDPINIHHNYADLEHHMGQNLWIHRKGATLAREGTMGIIPGSMGSPSYIVRGLGNPRSFHSCSHGAGRVMGRKEASRKLRVEDCDKAMEGIVFGRWGKDRKGRLDLGEAPQAYKDIDEVMEAQKDLVEIVTRLRPLGVIKG